MKDVGFTSDVFNLLYETKQSHLRLCWARKTLTWSIFFFFFLLKKFMGPSLLSRSFFLIKAHSGELTNPDSETIDDLLASIEPQQLKSLVNKAADEVLGNFKVCQVFCISCFFFLLGQLQNTPPILKFCLISATLPPSRICVVVNSVQLCAFNVREFPLSFSVCLFTFQAEDRKSVV